MKIDENVSTKALLEIDKRIDSLVKQIELLSYVNPVNIEEEKARFFSTKYLTEPVFKYPSINFDKFNLHRELFTIPIERIEDEEIRDLYCLDIQFRFLRQWHCLHSVATNNTQRFQKVTLPREWMSKEFWSHFPVFFLVSL